MDLECLGLYWNCTPARIAQITDEEKTKFLEHNVAKRGFFPDNFDYGKEKLIIRPYNL